MNRPITFTVPDPLRAGLLRLLISLARDANDAADRAGGGGRIYHASAAQLGYARGQAELIRDAAGLPDGAYQDVHRAITTLAPYTIEGGDPR